MKKQVFIVSIIFATFLSVFIISCQKEKESSNNNSSVAGSETKEVNPIFQINLFTGDDLENEVSWKMVDIDSCIWECKIFIRGVFQAGFMEYWIVTNPVITSFREDRENGNEYFVGFQGGHRALIRKVDTLSSQQLRISFIDDFDEAGSMIVTVNNIADFWEGFSVLANQNDEMNSKARTIPSWFLKFLQYVSEVMVGNANPCEPELSNRGAICSHYGCWPIQTDRTILCVSTSRTPSNISCSNYTWSCNR